MGSQAAGGSFRETGFGFRVEGMRLPRSRNALISRPVLVRPPSREKKKFDEKTRKFTKKAHLRKGVNNKPTMLI